MSLHLVLKPDGASYRVVDQVPTEDTARELAEGRAKETKSPYVVVRVIGTISPVTAVQWETPSEPD
jgi:hypothetical protein